MNDNTINHYTDKETIERLEIRILVLKVEIKMLNESVLAWQDIARDLNDKLEGE